MSAHVRDQPRARSEGEGQNRPMTEPRDDTANLVGGGWMCKKCGKPVEKTFRRTGDWDSETKQLTVEDVENVPCGDHFAVSV